MASVSIKKVNYGRKAKTNYGPSKIWTPNPRTKNVSVKDSKLPKPAGKQPTLQAPDSMKAKRGSVKSAKEPGAVNVKRQKAWSSR